MGNTETTANRSNILEINISADAKITLDLFFGLKFSKLLRVFFHLIVFLKFST